MTGPKPVDLPINGWPAPRWSTRQDAMFRADPNLTEADIDAARKAVREALEADTFNRHHGGQL